MYATLEPREVDRPFVKRWLRATLILLVRSPFRFGVLIAFLSGMDTLAVHLADGYVIEKVWVDRLGIVGLPLLWVLVSAVARGADDAGQTLQSLSHLSRRSVWVGALSIGIGMAAASWFFHSLFHGFGAVPVRDSRAYLQHQGDFLASIEGGVVLMVGVGGLALCPLLALVPELSAFHARSLSLKADRINNLGIIIFMTVLLAVGAIYLAAAVPAYGMTTATFLVFFGVLNYVAYRDMFERRADNLPQQVTSVNLEKIRHSSQLGVTLPTPQESSMSRLNPQGYGGASHRAVRTPFRMLAGILVLAGLVAVVGTAYFDWKSGKGLHALQVKDVVMIPALLWGGRWAFYAASQGTVASPDHWPFASDRVFFWYGVGMTLFSIFY